jgi:16S rRNA G966 N2-methylase RsmD
MINIIRHYFPIVRNDCNRITYSRNFISYKYLCEKIRYDSDAILYMTKRFDAELITGIIIHHTRLLDLDYEKIVITDATAGIGGNTFSFALMFQHVNAIEQDKHTFDMLQNNIHTYGFNNITYYNDDYMKLKNDLYQNIIFIDPPWGGRDYKKQNNIHLQLSEVDLEVICHDLTKKNNIVVLKLPLNYDFSKIYDLKNHNIKIFLHELKKMFIIVMYSEYLFHF